MIEYQPTILNSIFIHRKPIVFRGGAFHEPIKKRNAGFGKNDYKSLESIMEDTESFKFEKNKTNTNTNCRFVKYETGHLFKYTPFKSLRFSH